MPPHKKNLTLDRSMAKKDSVVDGSQLEHHAPWAHACDLSQNAASVQDKLNAESYAQGF